MFTDYKPTVGFDEYFCGETARPRADLAPLLASLGQMGLPELNRSHASASQLLRRLGATFRLNDSGLKGSERILPFDPLPRLIGRSVSPNAPALVTYSTGLEARLKAIDPAKLLSAQDIEAGKKLLALLAAAFEPDEVIAELHRLGLNQLTVSAEDDRYLVVSGLVKS